jgi:PhnB protein
MTKTTGTGSSATPEQPEASAAQAAPFAGPTVGGVPAGYHSVTPWIISRDTAALLAFAAQAFGAQELARVESDGVIGHAEFRIGDSVVMAFDARPGWPDTPAFLRLFVADGDATFRQALAAGATALTEMTTMFWGDRVGRVRDPLGNLWWIQTRLEDLDLAEIERRSALPEYVAAMAYVQGTDFFAAEAASRERR